MSAVESALDVLSRAATMVQGQFTSFGISFRDSHFADPDSLDNTRNDNIKHSKKA